ncbi:hypothetical protein [Kitasatospora cinereorecta]|uniref:Uncharacterized protein n=1 Tax=Kitasatospora cinereorecta TaxID=285560 RepID=A0ABW0V722_9ACTN
MPLTVAVECTTCAAPPRPPWTPGPPPAWAAVVGTEAVAWVAPGTTGRPMVRAQRPPAAGEEQLLGVEGPFLAAGAFWSLFAPPAVALDGAEDHPELLAAHAAVRCEPVEVVDTARGWALLRVRVLEVVDLAAAELLPPSDGPDGIADLLPPDSGSLSATRTDGTGASAGYLHLGWSVQGDLGRWAVLRRTPDGGAVLLLLASWGFDEHDVALGHHRLDPGGTAALLAHWP